MVSNNLRGILTQSWLTSYPQPFVMKVMIGVPTAEFSRQAIFYDYLDMLEKPVGTVVSRTHGQSVACNRNIIIQQALDYDCSHVFLLDDDVAFAPTVLNQLLEHDKDAVTGLYLMRSFPHKPLIFDKVMNDGKCIFYKMNGQSGLIPIVAAGLGCCLIKTKVFEVINKPWFTFGKYEEDQWGEDIYFFEKFRRQGFQAYCDLDIPVGHMGTVTIWPSPKGTLYDTHGESQVTVPAYD